MEVSDSEEEYEYEGYPSSPPEENFSSSPPEENFSSSPPEEDIPKCDCGQDLLNLHLCLYTKNCTDKNNIFSQKCKCHKHKTIRNL